MNGDIVPRIRKTHNVTCIKRNIAIVEYIPFSRVTVKDKMW